MFHHVVAVFVLPNLLQIQPTISQTGQCFTAKSCVGETINGTSDEHINCFGYGSCLNATHIETNRSEMDACSICCTGSYSCFNAKTIRRSAVANGEVWCNGLLSCAFVSDMHVEQGLVSCSGEQSCRGSRITLGPTAQNSDENLQCWGDRSCMDTNVTTQYATLMSGHLSGTNGVFYSDDNTTKYQFYGSNSGYNATIVCGTGHTCKVICTGNGCNGLTLVCQDKSGSNTNCTFNVDCNYAEKSDNDNVCPNGM